MLRLFLSLSTAQTSGARRLPPTGDHGRDFKSETDALVALRVVTPLHGVMPAFAEAQQTHVFRERALDKLISRTSFGIGRCDLKEFKRIV